MYNIVEYSLLVGAGGLAFCTVGVFLVMRFGTLGVLMAKKRFAQLEEQDKLLN